jgi:hypothetical protein
MREIRQSGSEGGGAESNHLSLPLYILTPLPRLGEGNCALLRDSELVMASGQSGLTCGR